MPAKYLLNINFLVQAVHLFDESANSDSRLEILQLLDVLSDRVKESKYREKIETKIKGVKIKLKTFPKGKSLGSAQYYIKFDDVRVLYLTEFAIQKEIHIEGVPHNFLLEKGFDVVLTTLVGRNLNRKSLKDTLEDLFNEVKIFQNNSNITILLIDQIPRIFEILLVMTQIVNEKEKTSLKIFLPYVYDYYINVMKRLSEYMSADIAQNFCVEENDFFSFEFISFYSEWGIKHHEGPKLIISSVSDFLEGKVFSIVKDFKASQKIDVVFMDEKAKKMYDYKLKTFNSASYSKSLVQQESNTSKSNNSSLNKLVGSSHSMVKDSKGNLRESTNQFSIGNDDSISKLDSWNESSTVEESKIMLDQTKENECAMEQIPIFYQLKNNDWTFIFKKEEITKSDYGNLLTEQEITLMAINDPGQTYDRSDMQNDINLDHNFTKTKEFFEDYLTYHHINDLNELLSKACFRELNFSSLASTQDQIILLAQLTTDKLVFLNKVHTNIIDSLNSNIKSLKSTKKIYTIEGSLIVNIIQKQLIAEISNDLINNLKLLHINKVLQYSKVKFGLKQSHGKNFEVVLKTMSDTKEYSILKERQLLSFKSYLLDHGVKSDLEIRRLNINDKIFVVKKLNSLVLEGVYCEEYFKTRKLLYDFINDS